MSRTIIFSFLFFSALQTFAEDPKKTVESVVKPVEGQKPPEVKEKVKLGVVAGTFKTGQAKSLDVESGGAVPGDDDSVVTGSVSHVDATTCVAKMSNAGKKTYNVSFVARGSLRNGAEDFSKSFSGKVAPGETLEKRISGCRAELNLSIELRSAKPID